MNVNSPVPSLNDHLNYSAVYETLAREKEVASTCKEDTRAKVLQEITARTENMSIDQVYSWCLRNSGKSTIAHAIEQSFAFGRQRERKDATIFFLSFACQLPMAFPSMKKSMKHALEEELAILHQFLDLQFTNLIIDPLLPITESVPPLFVATDGLDECGSEAQVHSPLLLCVMSPYELCIQYLHSVFHYLCVTPFIPFGICMYGTPPLVRDHDFDLVICQVVPCCHLLLENYGPGVKIVHFGSSGKSPTSKPGAATACHCGYPRYRFKRGHLKFLSNFADVQDQPGWILPTATKILINAAQTKYEDTWTGQVEDSEEHGMFLRSAVESI